MKHALRPANQEDQAEIRKLVQLGGINPTGLDWDRFVVAENQDGEVIGCAQLKPHRDGTVELASLVVVEELRGMGVARALIEHLVWLHPGTLYLMCRSGLGPLYERFGFYPLAIDEMPTYFRRLSKVVSILNHLRKSGETLLVMRRDAS